MPTVAATPTITATSTATRTPAITPTATDTGLEELPSRLYLPSLLPWTQTSRFWN